MNDQSNSTETVGKERVGKNEPCPCGSGKKYKRCHGKSVGGVSVSEALKNKKPKKQKFQMPGAGGGMPGAEGMGGVDPSQFDQGQLQEMASLMKRMPKGQVQKIQSMMQRAMAGKDVSAEAAQLEKTLPPEFHEMVKGMSMPGMEGMDGGADSDGGDEPEMSPEEARKIVEQARKRRDRFLKKKLRKCSRPLPMNRRKRDSLRAFLERSKERKKLLSNPKLAS